MTAIRFPILRLPTIRPPLVYVALFAVSFAVTLAYRLNGADTRHTAPLPAAAAHPLVGKQEFDALSSTPAPAPPAVTPTALASGAPAAAPVNYQPTTGADLNTDPKVIELRRVDQTFRGYAEAVEDAETPGERLAAVNGLVGLSQSNPEQRARIRQALRISMTDTDSNVAAVARTALRDLDAAEPDK